jgi:hypothetical protein
MLVNEQRKIEELVKMSDKLQNDLYDIAQKVTQNKKMSRQEFYPILKGFDALDNFVLNIKALQQQVGEFYLGED